MKEKGGETERRRQEEVLRGNPVMHSAHNIECTIS